MVPISLKITADSQGGSAVADTTTIVGGSIALSPGTPTRNGYTFTGWSTTTSGSAISFPYTLNQTSNFTLFARWSANTLTVNFDSQGGSAVANINTNTGSSITTNPGTPTRTGYTFTGWYLARSGGSAIGFPFAHNQTSNFTLFAQWSANALTVNFDSQGGSAVANIITSTGNAIATNPGTPTRPGYTFTGWSTTTSGSAISFPYTHNQTSNFTLFARWSANALTVNFDSQGGSAVANVSTTTGSSITTSPGTPNRAGYTFTGWSMSTNGSVIAFPYTHNQTANFTLFARWSANTLTVNFDSQGGSAVAEISTITGNAITTSPSSPTRAGYTFSGWSTTTGGSLISFPYLHNQTSNFTLYAIWSADTLNVIFDSQGGSALASGLTKTGDSVIYPGMPTRNGYTFTGWHPARSGGSAIRFPYMHNQTSNFTLFAHWSANTLNVNFDSQGGSAIADGITKTAGNVTNPGSPTRPGYTFTGWHLSKIGGSSIRFPYTHNRTSAFTLYAQWAKSEAFRDQVLFEISSTRLTDSAKISLDNFAREIKSYKAAGGKIAFLRITGFAQPTLRELDFMGLSWARANVVASYLTGLKIGIPLVILGAGQGSSNSSLSRKVDLESKN